MRNDNSNKTNNSAQNGNIAKNNIAKVRNAIKKEAIFFTEDPFHSQFLKEIKQSTSEKVGVLNG